MEGTLGIDTSCYTTSVALMDRNGILVAEERAGLIVRIGGRGLSQSEMIFQHVKNLPAIMEKAMQAAGKGFRIAAVGVSTLPRPQADSYMPVFLAGKGTARTLASALHCRVFELSHQENHLLAGLWSAGLADEKPFLAVHASGGTTEILSVVPGDRLVIELLGGTNDLNAGQFIDRVGVALGLTFPAGPQLEKLAEAAPAEFPQLPRAVKGMQISFSGPESHVQRWLESAPLPATVAAAVQDCIAGSLVSALEAAVDETGCRQILLVGGVGANQSIRRQLAESLQASKQARLFWPEPRFSGDNAVGAAWWALRKKAVWQ